MRQSSELFEWVGDRFERRQGVPTDGAHAAAFFSAADGARHFLAVANLGDRQAGTYRGKSAVYVFDPAGPTYLSLVQELPTLGATDFHPFDIGGTTFLAVSNEQDDTKGGDVGSSKQSGGWASQPRPSSLMMSSRSCV